MNLLISLPAVLSFIILAAHFLRAGNLPLVAVCLAAPLLLIWRRAWAVRIVQALLMVGSLLWLRTIVILIDRREQAGEPWQRMAIILGAVAAFTFISSLLLMLLRLRRPAPAPAEAEAAEPPPVE